MEEYFASHYDLSHTLVLSSSDGGSGYGKEVFDEIQEGKSFFCDHYHVNRTCREWAGWTGKQLLEKLQKALRLHDWKRVVTVLGIMQSVA